MPKVRETETTSEGLSLIISVFTSPIQINGRGKKVIVLALEPLHRLGGEGRNRLPFLL